MVNILDPVVHTMNANDKSELETRNRRLKDQRDRNADDFKRLLDRDWLVALCVVAPYNVALRYRVVSGTDNYHYAISRRKVT
jgi:hypothetical protein